MDPKLMEEAAKHRAEKALDKAYPAIPLLKGHGKPIDVDLLDELPHKIREALRSSRGQIRAAAEILGMPVRKLDYIVQMSRQTKDFLKQLKSRRIASEWDVCLLEQLEDDIKRSALIYKREALEAIADLAMMPIHPDNSGQNQVKLMAAAKLYSETGSTVAHQEIDNTLAVLNAEYQKAAPRIKSVRERVITFESDQNDGATVLEG